MAVKPLQHSCTTDVHRGVAHSAGRGLGRESQTWWGNYSVGQDMGNHGLQKVGLLNLKKRKPSGMRHHDYFQRHEDCFVDKE